MKRTTNRILLGAAAVAVGVAMAAAPASSVADGEEQFNLMFNGGSAVDYVEAIRQTTGETNIVLRSKVDRIQVPAVRLTGVTLDAALQLLDGQYTTFGNSRFRADVGNVRGQGSRPVYVIEVKEVSLEGPRPVVTRIWAVTDILAGDLEAQNMLTAIEIAIEMAEDGGPAPEIRFHPETQLLLARGGIEQVAAIEEALKGLRDSGVMRAQGAHMGLEQELSAARMRLAVMDAQAADLQTERDSMVMKVIELETRLDATHAELEALRRRLEEREQEMAKLKHLLLETEIRHTVERQGDG